MTNQIIKRDKSIIPACDVADLDKLRELVVRTCDVEGIGGYKIGMELVLKYGIRKVVATIREKTDLAIIYDHQKAATDIPAMGERFAEAVQGVNAVILFPTMGPETEKEWIAACKKAKLGVIVGGEMTHKGYLEEDGGYVTDDAPIQMYSCAAENGVTDFVVPGNKPEKIAMYRKMLEKKGIEPIFYSPGLVTQGGDITESAKAAGNKWHAIVGRGIYQAPDIHEAAKEMVKALTKE